MQQFDLEDFDLAEALNNAENGEGDVQSQSMLMLGSYYHNVKDYDNMKLYYERVIEKGNSEHRAQAMCFLGYYYQYVEEDYDTMKKYYEMAVEQGVGEAMLALCAFYSDIDFDSMFKYYEMVLLTKDSVLHSGAMYVLGSYYHSIKDYDNMKKYFDMAIALGNYEPAQTLGIHYHFVEKEITLVQGRFILNNFDMDESWV